LSEKGYPDHPKCLLFFLTDMDITEDLRVGQYMKEGQLLDFMSGQTSECGDPVILG
jgi:hypothetical protein